MHKTAATEYLNDNKLMRFMNRKNSYPSISTRDLPENNPLNTFDHCVPQIENQDS